MSASVWQRNTWLDGLGDVWAAPCEGDPDPSEGGTTVTGRILIELDPASNGARANTNNEEWLDMPDATVTHVAFFTAQTAGNYRGSAPVPSYDESTQTGGDVVSAGQRYRAKAGTIKLTVS